MLSLRKQQPQPAPPLPRQVAPLPMRDPLPPAPATAPAPTRVPTPAGHARNNHVLVRHEEFAQEAARAAQRYLDQVDEIGRLIDERDEWCNRALLAEANTARLEKREAELLAQIDNKNTEVGRERDSYKETLAIVGAQYSAASKILLDGFAAIRAVEGKLGPLMPPQPEQPRPERADHRDDPVDSVTAEVAETIFGAPTPRTVTDGPRYDEKGIDRDEA